MHARLFLVIFQSRLHLIKKCDSECHDECCNASAWEIYLHTSCTQDFVVAEKKVSIFEVENFTVADRIVSLVAP